MPWSVIYRTGTDSEHRRQPDAAAGQAVSVPNILLESPSGLLDACTLHCSKHSMLWASDKIFNPCVQLEEHDSLLPD